MYDRVTAAMDRIVPENRGRDIAVVTHGFAIEFCLGYARQVKTHIRITAHARLLPEIHKEG